MTERVGTTTALLARALLRSHITRNCTRASSCFCCAARWSRRLSEDYLKTTQRTLFFKKQLSLVFWKYHLLDCCIFWTRWYETTALLDCNTFCARVRIFVPENQPLWRHVKEYGYLLILLHLDSVVSFERALVRRRLLMQMHQTNQRRYDDTHRAVFLVLLFVRSMMVSSSSGRRRVWWKRYMYLWSEKVIALHRIWALWRP